MICNSIIIVIDNTHGIQDMMNNDGIIIMMDDRVTLYATG